VLAFGPPAILEPDGNAYAIVSADFNDDQRLDFATANYGNGTVSVLFGDGEGEFGEPSQYDAGKYAYSLAVGDFDEDGNLDLATGNLMGYDGINFANLSVLMNNGDGTFAVGDFNADGYLDLDVGG
jgi:hypothetical protein